MAHLFLASQIVAPDDPLRGGPRIPRGCVKVYAEKPGRERPPAAAAPRVPHINEVQLLAATGGTEMSCYRCTVPFGVVVLIAGVVVTAVAYAFNSHGSTISVLGLALLAVGLGLLAASAACRSLRRRGDKDPRPESRIALIASQDDGEV